MIYDKFDDVIKGIFNIRVPNLGISIFSQNRCSYYY